MILRLQSEQELELLQSRIKAKAKEVKVHLNEVQANRGTVSKAEWLAAKTTSKPRQEPLGAAYKATLLSPVTQSALEAEFLLQVRSLKQALPRLQYQPFPDRK